jgi:hypothetical protein
MITKEKMLPECLKHEIQRLVSLGVLKRCSVYEWSTPTFIIPKTNRIVRFISDFRKLNAQLKRKPYPIPKLSQMFQELERIKFATSLDLNIGYYTIRFDPDVKKLCTLVTHFGKYEYLRIPMGFSCSPAIFQENISDLMQHLEFVRTCLDNLLIISSSTFNNHLHKMELVLKLLSDHGLRVHAKKSTFCANEIEHLWYWFTESGIQHMSKKVSAIKNIVLPTNRKEFRQFIGMVNYYRDKWCRQSNLLAPLTSMTSKNVKLEWTEEHHISFETFKKIICREVMLISPDFSKPFHIYTGASDTQLGAVITQDDKHIAFCTIRSVDVM